MGKLIVEKREGFRYALIGSCLREEAIGGLTRSLKARYFMVYIFGFL